MYKKVKQSTKLIFHLYSLIWKVVFPRPLLKVIKLSYNKFCNKIFKLNGINDYTKKYIVQRIFYKSYKLNLDITKTTQRILYFESYYENRIVRILKKVLKGNDVAIDIGAHVGFYTLLLSTLVGENGKVYAFEPNDDSFQMLKRNVEINSVKNCHIYNIGASNINSKGKLYLHPENEGGSSLKPINNFKKIEEVDLIKLDDWFNTTKTSKYISLIKIDVERSETDVLRGMKNILSKFKPYLIIEILSDENYDRIKAFLRNLGYNYFPKITTNDYFCSAERIDVKEFKESYLSKIVVKLF